MEPRFRQSASDGAARAGEFAAGHGVFSTPNFMPVGTQGSVKGIDVERLKETGAEIMLVNTYHLWLRPGSEAVQALGGIHKFSGWQGPILSDSGGFQVYSLKSIRRLAEEGVEFKSYLDGSKRLLTPEKSIQIQEELGVDIAMALDECPAAGLERNEVERSLEMTTRWAKRCLAARKRSDMALFGITQGGVYPELRERAAAELSEMEFDGMAIGGVSVGEPKEKTYEILSYHAAQLPAGKIRYLMGVGTPQDIVYAVHCGIDLFDCVIPTRAGRCGRAYVRGEAPYLNLRNAKYQRDSRPLEEGCSCVACRNYSRAYINHLFKAYEMLGPQLLSLHNVTHYMSLMREIREAIREGRFESLYQAEQRRWRSFQSETDESGSELVEDSYV
jgi:queuine tRNA-ribosyltransferase